MSLESCKGRIALLTDGIAPWIIGGMQKHSFLLLKSLLKSGWKIDLYHPKVKGVDSGSEIPGLDPALRQNVDLVLVPFPEKGIMPGHYIKRSFHFSQDLLFHLHRRAPVQIIIAKGFTGWAFLEPGIKKDLPPVAVNFHGMEMFQKRISFRQALEQWLLRGPVRYNIRHADYVFSYGGNITTLLTQSGVKSEKIVEIPTGVEMLEIRSSEPEVRQGKRVFVFLGRWERRKGIQELSKAVLSLLQNNLDFEVHFIGPIPENKRIRSGSVVYHGEISDAQHIRDVLYNADVLVCPSYSEGMPNSILEGMSAGLAILATGVGAVPVMVDSANGIVFSNPDPRQIEEGMVRFLKMSDSELLAMKRNSLEKCRSRFNWEMIGKEMSGWVSAHIRP